MSDTDTILKAIDKLEETVVKNHSDIKKTLFGEEGTGGICHAVHSHDMLLLGINGTPGLSQRVEKVEDSISAVKDNQKTWNKWLTITQGFAYGILAYFGVKGQ